MGKFLYETSLVKIFQGFSEIFATNYSCTNVQCMRVTNDCEIIGREGALFLYNVLVHKLTQH